MLISQPQCEPEDPHLCSACVLVTSPCVRAGRPTEFRSAGVRLRLLVNNFLRCCCLLNWRKL